MVVQSTEKIGLSEHACDAVSAYHGKVFLRSGQGQFNSSSQGLMRFQHLEVRQHGPFRSHAGKCGFDTGHTRLGRRTNPDEDGDEHQEQVVAKAQQSQEYRHSLGDTRGYSGGFHRFHPQGQQRAEYSSAIHRQGREQVERRQQDVDKHQALKE